MDLTKFGQFELKDLITVAIAIVGLALGLWNAWGNWRAQLKEQAEFAAEIVYGVTADGTNSSGTADQVSWLVLTNIGNGPAYALRAQHDVDPRHLLGINDTVQGPMKPDETIGFSYQPGAVRPEGGQLANHSTELTITWKDRFGIARAQVFAFASIPNRRMSDGEKPPKVIHATGRIGAVKWLDQHWLRARWVNRFED
ncbi:hypothetical protein SPF06_07170 [Sinomonas sp. JGH33]|uniref:Uncharacterized protein n=1 Tax=Sinomonas terricola TaxID=3110330 RepID=A0ABU5T4A6_9MICC|nr:hypothetical protein [Sinomonas sp. JGH33]MEA5454498.1 hypothetical protein [Sinomonas sp. JGH33]